MIIDVILDRKDDERAMSEGYTHKKDITGRVTELKYNAHEFYYGVFRYISGTCGREAAIAITRAMDAGTEDDVKRELCRYIIEYGYNPELCDYINSRNWLN